MRDKYNIVSNRQIADGVFEMKINAHFMVELARPGKFVNVYLQRKDLLLPRPISIADADIDGGFLTLVYAVVGAGTTELSELIGYTQTPEWEGGFVELMGPFGNGFFAPGLAGCVGGSGKVGAFVNYDVSDIDQLAPSELIVGADEVLLIGGGLGVAPLLFAARELQRVRQLSAPSFPRVRAFLGFPSDAWYLTEFEKFGVEVSAISDTVEIDGRTGTVVDLLNAGYAGGGKKTLALTCGPLPMMKAVYAWCSERGIPLRASLEARMGCGYGACVGCAVDVKAGGSGTVSAGADEIIHKKVCSDGPVFAADEIVW